MSTIASPKLIDASATIANGESLSGAIDLGNAKLVAIQMPSSWTAASLTFQGSYDGTTYADMYDGGTERTITTAASRLLMLSISDWVGVRYIKVRSGTSAAAVNQGGARTLSLVLQP